VALRDPVAIYNAANNMEANHLCNVLVDAGIEAYLTEDISVVGQWVGGFIPEIHKPQVWVDRADVERLKPILDEYERRKVEVQGAAPAGSDLVTTECEECGKPATFPAALRGTVQSCPHCHAYLDVDDDRITGELPDFGASEMTEE
jgi:hypothetical protein